MNHFEVRGGELACETTPLSQIAIAPLSLCQRRSLWPLPSKSPVPTICQLLATLPAPEMIWALLIWPLSQIETAPLSFCQRMSLWPLPSNRRYPRYASWSEPRLHLQ